MWAGVDSAVPASSPLLANIAHKQPRPSQLPALNNMLYTLTTMLLPHSAFAVEFGSSLEFLFSKFKIQKYIFFFGIIFWIMINFLQEDSVLHQYTMMNCSIISPVYNLSVERERERDCIVWLIRSSLVWVSVTACHGITIIHPGYTQTYLLFLLELIVKCFNKYIIILI